MSSKATYFLTYQMSLFMSLFMTLHILKVKAATNQVFL